MSKWFRNQKKGCKANNFTSYQAMKRSSFVALQKQLTISRQQRNFLGDRVLVQEQKPLGGQIILFTVICIEEYK